LGKTVFNFFWIGGINVENTNLIEIIEQEMAAQAEQEMAKLEKDGKPSPEGAKAGRVDDEDPLSPKMPDVVDNLEADDEDYGEWKMAKELTSI
jgi:hypothetical protein